MMSELSNINMKINVNANIKGNTVLIVLLISTALLIFGGVYYYNGKKKQDSGEKTFTKSIPHLLKIEKSMVDTDCGKLSEPVAVGKEGIVDRCCLGLVAVEGDDSEVFCKLPNEENLMSKRNVRLEHPETTKTFPLKY